MPWTLYRYILKDLLKLLVISTAALVLVIGFAATIKPLMDGMLDPMGMLKLFFYTVPTVLGFALPFSAAFASTLVLSRMASDNEIQACRAAGLSYGTILLPVIFLGLVLTVGLYYMSNWVVPNFYRSAEGMIQKNLVQMILTQIQKREPVEIPGTGMVVYANDAYEVEPKPNPQWEHQPERLLVFEGVAAGRVLGGQLRNEATAERAEVLLYRIDGETWIQMRLTNVLAVDQGQLVQAASAPMTPIRVPNPLKDRARFLSWPELRQIMRQPEQFDDVAQLKGTLIQAMALQDMAQQMHDTLAAGQPVTLQGIAPGETYVILAPEHRLQDHTLWLTGTADQPVRVRQFERGLLRHQFETPHARLSVQRDQAELPGQAGDPLGNAEPLIQLSMQQVSVTDVRSTAPPSRQRSVERQHLRWTEPVVAPLGELSAMDLLATVDAQGSATAPPVLEARQALSKEIDLLWRKLISQVHERAASAVSCLLVLVLGSVLSIKLRDRMPLVVYFWTFLLAFIAVVIINSGDKLADSTSSRGLVMALTAIWMGNVVVAVALALNYWKLSRT